MTDLTWGLAEPFCMNAVKSPFFTKVYVAYLLEVSYRPRST